MAGLSVLLEPHSKSHPGGKAMAAQIISKATLVIRGGPNHKPQVPVAATAAGSFLQRCFLCRRDLPEGMDIFMYRGDRAFCSEECRCRQIFMDEDAATQRGSRRVAY